MCDTAIGLSENETIANSRHKYLQDSSGSRFIDIRKLQPLTGICTFDPGFTSTGAAIASLTFTDVICEMYLDPQQHPLSCTKGVSVHLPFQARATPPSPTLTARRVSFSTEGEHIAPWSFSLTTTFMHEALYHSA